MLIYLLIKRLIKTNQTFHLLQKIITRQYFISMHFKMKNIQVFYSLALLILALPFIGKSQTIRTITLNEAIKLGLEHSQQLKISGAKYTIATAKREQFWGTQIPTVSLVSGYSRLSDNVAPFKFQTPGSSEAIILNPQILNQFTNRISAQQVVFSGLRAVNFYKSAEFLEKAAALDIDKDRIEIKNNIAAAYYNLYKLEASNEILGENLKVLRGRYNDVQNFVKNGTALENDALKADLAISQLEMAKKDVENAIHVALYNACILLGLPTDTRLELDKSNIFPEKTLNSLDFYLNSLTSRPDISATELRRQSAFKNIEVAKGGVYPVISLNANYYENRPNQRVFPQQDAFKGTWDAGILLTYNLTGAYTTKFQVKEAQANLAQTDAFKTQITEGAKMEVTANFYAYQSAIDKIALTLKSITQSTENQRVMKNKFDAQMITIGELLDSDFLVLQAKLNLEAAKSDAEIAYYKLLKSVGN